MRNMTFSIIVREPTDDDCDTSYRYGVGVTTNNPGIGVFCPFTSEHGAVATQYQTHGKVGPQIKRYLTDGVRAEDAVLAVVNSTDLAENLQIHALCKETRGYHTGRGLDNFHDETDLIYGERTGQNWSVAGNSLVSTDVLDSTGDAYTSADTTRPLAVRLIEALKAGDEAGGDGRDNNARSAAICITDPTAGLANEWYNNLRVDASKTPLTDLQQQYELAKSFHETASKEW